jgi:aspartokinase/homoserine dehydrogenase 1
MKVLKFGGTSVANAENLNKVAAIILNTIQSNTAIVVVSAMSGITDTLIQTGKLAEQGQAAYKTHFDEITQRHIQTAQQLLPPQALSQALSQIQIQCNALEQLYEGVFLLNELSARTLDHIVSLANLCFRKYYQQNFKVCKCRINGTTHAHSSKPMQTSAMQP